VDHERLRLLQQGLDAWRRGDLAAVEAMFDPAATWHATEPGEWDCRNRGDIVHVLRERFEQGFARADVEVIDARGDSAVMVSYPSRIGGDEWPDLIATVFSFEANKIVAMRDYRTREEALAAAQRGG
jgi:ketosteroid isomerase-like protein